MITGANECGHDQKLFAEFRDQRNLQGLMLVGVECRSSESIMIAERSVPANIAAMSLWVVFGAAKMAQDTIRPFVVRRK